MPTVSLHDPQRILRRRRVRLSIDFLRALLLLGIATAPAPGSRYRTDSRWAILKYVTVYDPRRRRAAGTNPFIINPGIQDLDPHQKTILSDDMGVACALGVVDQLFGIVGIADVYQWHQLGHINFLNQGRHRKMPDFVIVTSRPLNRSNLILLECKGSQTRNYHVTQLQVACNDQLGNVDTVFGIPASTVPRLAIASYFPLGGQGEIHVSDPPTKIDDSEGLQKRLIANYLGLEYSFFGDFRSANSIWASFDLPTWRDEEQPFESWPDKPPLLWRDATLSTFEAHPKFRGTRAVGVERALEEGSCAASSEIEIEGSIVARNLRQQEAWGDLAGRETRTTAEAPQVHVDDVTETGERVISETAETFAGVTIRGKLHIWRRAD